MRQAVLRSLREVFNRPRFRRRALWLVGVCVIGTYLWSSLIERFLFRRVFADFKVFLAGAQALEQGRDPYLSFLVQSHYDFAPNYLYPPMVAWLVQPLLGIGVENAALLVLVILQVCVVAFLWLTYRTLRPVSRHEIAFGVILSLSFGPLFANLWNDQVNVVLLPLCAAVLLAYCRGDRWWGGATYGLAMALKPLQPVMGLLLFWGRRGRMLAAAVIVGLVVLVIPGPGLASEFVFKVLPALSKGTGLGANAAPAGFLERLLHPTAFYDARVQSDLVVNLLSLVVVVSVIALTWWRLGRRPRTTSLGRATEMAVAMAASPLILPVSNSWHLVLLLIPILVLIRVGLANSSGWVVTAALVSFLFIGPVYYGLERLISIGFFPSGFAIVNDPVVRIWTESQLLGMVILWLGCLRALNTVPQRVDKDIASLAPVRNTEAMSGLT